MSSYAHLHPKPHNYTEDNKELNDNFCNFRGPLLKLANELKLKDYELEVYDLSGRKLMQTTGNTLDMSVLSNATYIVKAFDKETKETNSYKVVKK